MPSNSMLSIESIISFGSKFSMYCSDDVCLDRVEKRPIGSLKLARDHTAISLLACLSHEPNVFINWLQQFVNCYVFDSMRYVASYSQCQSSLTPVLQHKPAIKPILKRFDTPIDANSFKKVRFEATSYVKIISQPLESKPDCDMLMHHANATELPIIQVSSSNSSSSLNSILVPDHQETKYLTVQDITNATLLSDPEDDPVTRSSPPKPENLQNDIRFIDATIRELRHKRKALKKQHHKSKLDIFTAWFCHSHASHNLGVDEQVHNIDDDTEHFLSYRLNTSSSSRLKANDQNENHSNDQQLNSLRYRIFSLRHRDKTCRRKRY